MNNISGIITLPTNMCCLTEALTIYDASIADIQVKIHFPRYEKLENRIQDNKILLSPEITKDLRRGDKKFDWGMVNYQSPEINGCIVRTIAIECKEEDAQKLYESINPWLARFQQYCFLCNKQFFNVIKPVSSGGTHLELVGNQGYIRPENPPIAEIALQLAPVEAYLKREHIEKAIGFASSEKHIRPEYEFMQQAYEAEEKHQHRLSIIDACSALEMCLMKQIDGRVANLLPNQIPEGKRRYLEQLIEYMGKLDYRFQTMESDLKTKVVEIRNDILHQNRNPNPTRMTACEAIEKVDEILHYFYEDYAE